MTQAADQLALYREKTALVLRQFRDMAMIRAREEKIDGFSDMKSIAKLVNDPGGFLVKDKEKLLKDLKSEAAGMVNRAFKAGYIREAKD